MILDKVQFETGSAKILPASNSIIDAVAATLKGHPEFLVLEVAGHADERSSDEFNLNLTKLRAASVMAGVNARVSDANGTSARTTIRKSGGGIVFCETGRYAIGRNMLLDSRAENRAIAAVRSSRTARYFASLTSPTM